MITFDIFSTGLLIVSTLTSLVTEAIKNVLSNKNMNYQSNILAGVVSTILSTMIGVAYIVMNGIAFNAQIVVYLVGLIFMSWLCAMVGYDKVMQAVTQFKKG
jgi:uncharacterized paraquat-inducible protein A